MVEGGIDFDGVEKFGEESGFVKTLGARLGIKDAFPIGIGPAGGTDVNLLGAVGLICGFLDYLFQGNTCRRRGNENPFPTPAYAGLRQIFSYKLDT